MRLQLDRPIVFFDLETTGINVLKDRIVEIALLKIFPDSTEKNKVYRFNPGMPIPEEASKVHKIYDKDVAGEPKFEDMAREVAMWFEGSDIAGFNSIRFDIPMLMEEMKRAGIDFQPYRVNLVDVQNIFHKKEPRNLAAAYRFYCGGEDFPNAHSALADISATWEVLKAQLDRYEDLPPTVDGLARFSNIGKHADLLGKLAYNDKKEIVVNFGSNKGKRLSELDSGFLNWMLSGSFPADTKEIVKAELAKRK